MSPETPNSHKADLWGIKKRNPNFIPKLSKMVSEEIRKQISKESGKLTEVINSKLMGQLYKISKFEEDSS